MCSSNKTSYEGNWNIGCVLLENFELLIMYKHILKDMTKTGNRHASQYTLALVALYYLISKPILVDGMKNTWY